MAGNHNVMVNDGTIYAIDGGQVMTDDGTVYDIESGRLMANDGTVYDIEFSKPVYKVYINSDTRSGHDENVVINGNVYRGRYSTRPQESIVEVEEGTIMTIRYPVYADPYSCTLRIDGVTIPKSECVVQWEGNSDRYCYDLEITSDIYVFFSIGTYSRYIYVSYDGYVTG